MFVRTVTSRWPLALTALKLACLLGGISCLTSGKQFPPGEEEDGAAVHRNACRGGAAGSAVMRETKHPFGNEDPL